VILAGVDRARVLVVAIAIALTAARDGAPDARDAHAPIERGAGVTIVAGGRDRGGRRDATLDGIAEIGRTWIAVVAIDGDVAASAVRQASVHRASVRVVAGRGGASARALPDDVAVVEVSRHGRRRDDHRLRLCGVGRLVADRHAPLLDLRERAFAV
jgi:hypothetical protein